MKALIGLPGRPRPGGLLGLGLAVVVSFAGIQQAHASYYRVSTSEDNIQADVLNKDDGYCSLAEAVASANAGSQQYDCKDLEPQFQDVTIELTEDSDTGVRVLFTDYHFVVGRLYVETGRVIGIYSSGNTRAKIDSASSSAFRVRENAYLQLANIDVTHIGGGAGKLVNNYGTLEIYDGILSGGNALSYESGLGAAIYNHRGVVSLDSVVLTNNQSKRGGALANNNGHVVLSNTDIIGNTATMIGGGIYNFATNSSATISASNTRIMNNRAPSGGGIFNSGGSVALTDSSSVSENTAEGCGSGFNSCPGNDGPNPPCLDSCDRAGGGIVNIDTSTKLGGVVVTQSSLRKNKADGRGGAIINGGNLNLDAAEIRDNLAQTGAAIYTGVSFPGVGGYCEVRTAAGDAWIVGNQTTDPMGYSIVASSGDAQIVEECTFEETNGQIFASGNSAPACEARAVRAGSTCPQ